MIKTILLTNNKELIRSMKQLRANITIARSIEGISNAKNIIIDRKCGISSREIASLKNKFSNIEVVLDTDEIVLKSLELIIENFKSCKIEKLFNMVKDTATTKNEKEIATNFLIRELA